MSVRSWLVCLCLLGLFSSQGLANENNVNELLPSNWTWPAPTRGNTCGVYAVARALELIGQPTDISEFWNSEFIGQAQGSTPEELLKAITSKGGHGKLLSKMSFVDLAVSNEPIIANVRRDTDNAAYNHWVCVSSTNDGLQVFDGANPGTKVAYADFLAQWNGIGIVVAPSRYAIVKYLVARIMVCICILGTIGILLRVVRAILPTSSFDVSRQFASFAGVVVLFGSLVALSLNMTYRNRPASLEAVAPFTSVPTKHGTLTDIYKANEDTSILLVDARMTHDYSYGTIGRAVNIPVTAASREIEEFLRKLPRTTPITIFCQSEVCPYDDTVAKKLFRIGFTDLIVSDLGYAEHIALQTSSTQSDGG